MPNYSVILIEPENEGNIGAIIRVMRNFEVEKLIVINPKVDIRSNIVKARAMHGRDLIDKIISFPNLSKLPKFDYLIGTTAKPSGDHNVLRICINPEELTENLDNFEGNIGILFGREGSGLTNEELEICDCCVHIPASDNYPTLNLSHACCIILYELYKMNKTSTSILYRPANIIEKQTLLTFFDLILGQLNKIWSRFNEKRKADADRIFRNILGRSFLSGREAFTMNGVLRYIYLSIKRKYKL